MSKKKVVVALGHKALGAGFQNQVSSEEAGKSDGCDGRNFCPDKESAA